MKLSLTKSLRIVAVSIITISSLYVFYGVTKNMWVDLWFLYLVPFLVWWVLDLKFNYTRFTIFYRGMIPLIVALYLCTSLFYNEWINTLVILAFIPFFTLIYNAKFYPLKFSIIPIVASFILIIYLSVGFFANIWHPTWMMFIIVPLMPLFQNYD